MNIHILLFFCGGAIEFSITLEQKRSKTQSHKHTQTTKHMQTTKHTHFLCESDKKYFQGKIFHFIIDSS